MEAEPPHRIVARFVTVGECFEAGQDIGELGFQDGVNTVVRGDNPADRDNTGGRDRADDFRQGAPPAVEAAENLDQQYDVERRVGKWQYGCVGLDQTGRLMLALESPEHAQG